MSKKSAAGKKRSPRTKATATAKDEFAHGTAGVADPASRRRPGVKDEATSDAKSELGIAEQRAEQKAVEPGHLTGQTS